MKREDLPGARRIFHLPRGEHGVPDDVDAELRYHIEERVEELVAQGMPRAQAEAEARARFGDVARVSAEVARIDRATHRGRERGEWGAAVGRELQQGARTLLRAPGFAAVAVLTLALGIGAATAIFTVLDRIVLRPLPYADAGRLVYLSSPVPGWKPGAAWGVSQAGYFYFQQHARSFAGIGAFRRGKATLVSDGHAERVRIGVVTASLLDVLRLRPAAGRLIGPDDDRPNVAPVAVLGYDFWRMRFGGDRSIIGRPIDIESNSIPVIGVMARGSDLPDYAVDVWLPRQLDPAAQPVNSHMEFETVARLAPGITPAAASAEVAALTARFPSLFPTAYSADFMASTRFTTKVTPLRDHVVGTTAGVLWILLAAVGLVLLIACANVANLFLVRIESRRRDMAIRIALGAGRAHLAWHVFAESLLVAAAAAALGLAFAGAAIRALLALAPAGLPRIGEVHLAGASVACAVVVAVAAAAAFGLLPLLRWRRRDGIDLDTLRDGSRGLSASRRQHAVRGALVAGQVALALVLLAAAGLLLRSWQRLRNVQPGFTPANALAVDLALPHARYQAYERVMAFHRALAARLSTVPGVASVGATQRLPLDVGDGCSAVFAEDNRGTPGAPTPCVATEQVTPGYFRALGIPVEGRAPDWSDAERRAGDVVVSRALAERLWPGENPIGKGIRGNGYGEPYYRVTGIAGDVHELGLEKPVAEIVYFPMLPLRGAPLWYPPVGMTLVVRASGIAPASLTGAVRAAVAELDPAVPIENARTMDSVVDRSMARLSFTMLLIGTAGAMALLLSIVGLYGVISYIVSQRRGEMGIRVALGAPGGRVARLVVAQSMRLALIGVAIGVAAALALTRVLRSLLYDVSPTDPLTLGAVAAVLLAVAALASWLPARRAARVDPIEALRAE